MRPAFLPPAGSSRIGFIFSGQGSQRPGMGRQLLEQEPAFRETVLECDRILRELAGWSIVEELSAPEERSRLDQTEIVQPCLFALQVGLVALWQEWGVVPGGVVGHSVGEIAAAHVGGVLSLREAVQVACHRGRLMQRTTGLGRMAAVALSSDDAQEAVARAGLSGQVSIAARNAPSSTVLSGDTAAVEEMARQLEARGVAVKMLPVNYAFHSAQMEPVLAELAGLLDGLKPGTPRIPVFSTVRGGLSQDEDYGAAYWPRNVRCPVLFGPSLAGMIDKGFDTFVEIGPHPVLFADATRCIEAKGGTGKALSSLRRGVDERQAMLRSLEELSTSGHPVRQDELPMQDRLRSLIASVLGTTAGSVDVDQPIIGLGMDSLGAAETKSRAERELGLRIPLGQLLGELSIAQLAGSLSDQAGGSGAHGGAAPRASLRKAESRSTSPLSEAQKGLWVIYKLAPTTAAYNSTFAARIVSELDADALRRAFQGVVDRHPSLRTTFGVQGGKPQEQVHDRAEAAFEVEQVPSLGDDQVRERMIEEGRRPFDLERGPVIRAKLYSRSAGDHFLLLAVHHIVYDRWSLNVILDDLRALYRAERAGEPAVLSPLEFDYLDFVAWQSDMLSGPEGAELWDYWKEQLSGKLSPTTLPADRKRPPVESYRGASVELELDADVTRRLRDLAHAEKKTLYTTLVGAFQLLLHHYSGQEDVVINSPMFGLRRPEFQRVVGDFINPVVLRTQVTPGTTFREQLERTAATVMGAIEHQEFPYQLVIERLRAAKSLGRTEAFRIMFNLVGEPRLAPVDKSGGLELQPVSMPLQEGQFDLACRLVEGESGIRGNLAYATDLYDRSTIGRLAGQLRVVLDRILEDPGRTVSELCAGIGPLVERSAEAAPSTAPGVERTRVPAPAGSGLADAEGKIIEIWKSVLSRTAVGPNDNFFDLGGDSLAILQVQDRLGEAFGSTVPVMELFQRPTVGALAEYFLQAGGPSVAPGEKPSEGGVQTFGPARRDGYATEKELRIRHRRRWRGR